MNDQPTDPLMYHSTEAWFVRHMVYPEQTKPFVFRFVFVLSHEQPIMDEFELGALILKFPALN